MSPARVLAYVSTLGLIACGSSNAASLVSRAPPSAGEQLEPRCIKGRLDPRPLVVALSSADKLAMESRVRSGLLVVKYADCAMELLPRCTAEGTYKYWGGTLKRDTIGAKNEDELFARIPLGAAHLSGKLRSSGKISVAMASAGRFETDGVGPDARALEGDCAGATHWVSALTVGAYRMAAGTDAEARAEAALFGAAAGGASTSSYEALSEDGEGAACGKAADGDTRPPRGCGALLRLEVQPLKGGP